MPHGKQGILHQLTQLGVHTQTLTKGNDTFLVINLQELNDKEATAR